MAPRTRTAVSQRRRVRDLLHHRTLVEGQIFPHGAKHARFAASVIHAAWGDFALLAIWLIVFSAFLIWLGDRFTFAGAAESVALGVVLPLLIFHNMVGMTVYLHHTHPSLPWFRTPKKCAHSTGRSTLPPT